MPNRDFIRQLPGGDVELKQRELFWHKLHIDWPLLILLMMVTALGLVILYSGSGQSLHYVKRQSVAFAVAYAVMLSIAQMNMLMIKRWAPFFYLGGVLLLVLVLFVGSGAKGAQRWLSIPGLPRFQPSEIMKVVLPIAMAAYFDKRILPPQFKHFCWSIVIVMIPTILILREPDLGTAILIAVSGISVLFLAGLHWGYFAISGLVTLCSTPVLWFYVLKEYQKQRIITLLNPNTDVFGAGWNIFQSKTAIGSGGVYGKGWLKGTQSQLDFLPESHTDFIIAVLAEEKGLIGVIVLLSLYLMIVIRGLYISMRAQETFGRLLAGSITLTFFVYIVVNMLMVSGLLPVVGVPLPLVSHGGTSIVSLMCGFGMLMAIGTEDRKLTA